jgi:hypothetical protein
VVYFSGADGLLSTSAARLIPERPPLPCGHLRRCNVAELSPKAPIVSGDTRDPALNIDSAKWRQIEKAYGLSLPPNVRADVV